MVDIIVIGAGPSGMSAALNSLRAGHSVLILEREAIGGQIATSPRVENLPSIKEVSGEKFAFDFYEQIDALGVQFELEDVLKVEKLDKYLKVTTNYNVYECKAVIIANGVTHRKMNLPKEEDLVGKGISYCAVCDGAFYKGKDVYLIGDANTAIQYALLLANYTNSVKMFTLFDRLFGDKILIDRLLANPKIEVTHNYNLIEYKGENELEGLVFEDTQDHSIHEYKTDNVFIAIGQIPNNEFLEGFIDMEKGFILTNESMETNVPGVYAVGDTRKKDIRQVVTAVSDGSIAAIKCDQYLNSL